MSNSVQVIKLPNTLRAKVGGKLAKLDQASIDKAELALQDLSTQFHSWLIEEVDKLEERHAAIKTDGLNRTTIESIYFTAHDLKGLGSTYGYPLITRLAASLCKMFDDEEKRVLSPRLLIDAHIDAIRASVRNEIKEDTHPVGKALVETLEARVKEHMASLDK